MQCEQKLVQCAQNAARPKERIWPPHGRNRGCGTPGSLVVWAHTSGAYCGVYTVALLWLRAVAPGTYSYSDMISHRQHRQIEYRLSGVGARPKLLAAAPRPLLGPPLGVLVPILVVAKG